LTQSSHRSYILFSLHKDKYNQGHAPDSFLPQFFRQHNGPHRLLASTLTNSTRACLSLVPNKLSVHTALNHTEEHRLDSAVQLVVLRAEVGGANVGKNCLADACTKRRGSRAWK
jgi:hypothetical protein